MKNGYLVQLHLHTSDTSRCGHDTGADIAKACKAAGYSLIAITDHFFNANIGCDSSLAWNKKVEYLLRGYRSAKKAGDEIGLKVIFGWETFQLGRELLTYGLDENFLLSHPDLDKVPYYEYIKIIKDAGGRIIHAHPYRQAPYIPDFHPDPESVEAYEVYNAGNREEEWNEKALKEAREHNLLQFAGSDAHSCENVVNGAMLFENEVNDIHDIFKEAANGKSQIIRSLKD
ncbi:MAG: histidinol-phosphatase [Clostridia bacterium]|nr:histidinol-phosphatase [Clostridia bacterium]